MKRVYGRKQLTSPRDVVDALGGTSQTARLLRVGPSQVSNMLKHGIPPCHHKRIELYCNHIGYEVDHAEVFGYTIESLLEGIDHL